MMNEKALCTARELAIGYGKTPLLSDICLGVQPGQILTLIGPNGAGKSTLLRTLAGQLAPMGGTVLLAGKDLTAYTGTQRAQKLALMAPHSRRMELTTCFDFVSAGRYPYTGRLGDLRAEDKQLVEESLRQTDALDIAEQNPDRPVIFMGVGFETTTPTIAAAILEAEARGLLNFSVYCAHKTTPPALRAIANDPETAIDGFILPGHVATITGLAPFSFLIDEFDTPGVVTGFEPVDILQGICMLVQMVVEDRPASANAYRRGVNADGNPVARQLVEQVFEPCDTTWRGLGPIANSGLSIRPEFSRFDARTRFDVPVEEAVEPRGCRCGDVLRGAITPSSCPLFGRTCTPEHPVGPCMVSSEGSCAAHYRYRD